VRPQELVEVRAGEVEGRASEIDRDCGIVADAMTPRPKRTRETPNAPTVPTEVEGIWAAVKDRTARQLFHADASKRLAAVAALERKHPGHAPRATLLLAAAVGEPSSQVRAAMLSMIASTGYFCAWRECARLRAAARVFVDDPDPAVRAALALCFEAMPVPVVADDVGWIAALVTTPEGERDAIYGAMTAMLVRTVRQGVAVDEALAVLAQMMEHRAFGYRARWAALELGPLGARLAPALTAWVESGADDAVDAAGILARCTAGSQNARVVAALTSLRDRQTQDAWVGG
jgi:hypothetical protein